MTEAELSELGHFIEMMRSHKVNMIETRIGPFKIHMERMKKTIVLRLLEVIA